MHKGLIEDPQNHWMNLKGRKYAILELRKELSKMGDTITRLGNILYDLFEIMVGPDMMNEE